MALPPNILIVGGGVFGLSTALSLSKRHPGSQITLVESSPTIPNPHGSSVDTSRIVRADYANAAYSKLAAAAIQRWRTTDWGREGRYTQNGLLLVYPEGGASAEAYARKSYANVRQIEGDNVVFLPSQADVLKVVPPYGKDLEVAGGYVNWGSGWSDAAASVQFAKALLDRETKVAVRTGTVERVLYDTAGTKPRATGVALADGSVLTADLVILAAGAWTPQLVDLRGKAVATGQAIAYIEITDAEQRELENLPTILNFDTGMFIIPPRDNLLKIARHAYGYRNPTTVPVPGVDRAEGKMMRVSLPMTGTPIPLEGEEAFRAALKQLLPRFVNRPFASTRICWYTDTPDGDFIVSYHPEYEGLFLATGGSGHAFKFFPVIGDKVVDALERTLDPELQALWTWNEPVVPREADDDGEDLFDGDGSRSGARNSNLKEELAKTKKATRMSAL
ncbi:hypothetical protein N7462_006496 [Penicillium macrosclerotiorum]|uniref:uncharacterized protein n=1 Tax=Penicillium macrosclerotiorum TaxID=303699 RepID=UPI00254698D5|nr:uncharacterized protein N7462_006496 [Penicillium macrosclerotiorum]KAJ5683331.1 hypothetical protein N7462_006496 [Penicillium macrosclerotiorum]